MTAEESLVSIIGPLVDGRIFPDVAPFDTPRPYVTYQKIGGSRIKPLARTLANMRNGLYQINTWADTRASANALADSIADLLSTSAQLLATPEAEYRSDHDSDLNRYGTIQDFSIWTNR